MEQQKEIEEYNRNNPGFRVLHGTEMDILGDGRLDFPDEVLKSLDLVIASIHSGFKQPRGADHSTDRGRHAQSMGDPDRASDRQGTR